MEKGTESDKLNPQEVSTPDDEEEMIGTRPCNSFENASCMSKLFFTWPQKLLQEGLIKPIEEKDLPAIMTAEESKHNRKIFEQIWKGEIDRVERLKSQLPLDSKKRASLRPSLQRALVVDFFRTTWIVQPLMFASSAARIAMSVALGFLIQSFIDETGDGYWWAGVLIFCNAIVLFEHHHVFFITWRKGMQLRIGAVASIFAKSLRLNSVGGGEEATSTGQIMNLVSNDVERFMLTTLFISYVIWAPIQAVAILIIGLYLIGPAFALGIGLLIFVFVPLQFYLSKRFASLRSKVASITDQRMTLVSQAIGGVRVMKMSGWENELQKRIDDVRASEVAQIYRANKLKALNEALFFSVNVVISIAIFISHVFIFEGSLTTRNVFTILSLMSVLQIELTKHLSLGIMAGSECWVSVRRIHKYLESPELLVENDPSSSSHADCAIKLTDVTCYWDGTKSSVHNEEVRCGRTVALSKVNLSLKKNGDLLFIVGAVGSGKSALLYALAGELAPSNGTVNRSYKSLAYASQSPWIMNGTIRSNILMGRKLDEKFYSEVVQACGLAQDFTQFVDGDETIVGDRGVQCSGGQKARIGLARALYRDAEVLLLDDPLSAVDSRVGRLIYYSAIQDLSYKRGKCVVLVTHQHQYIGRARCAFMSNGELKHIGTFEECVANSGGKLHRVSHNAEESGEKAEITVDDEDSCPDPLVIQDANIKSPDLSKKSALYDKSENNQEEKTITGVVTKATFLHYARSTGSVWWAFALMLLFIVTQVLQLASIAMLGRWSEYPPDRQQSANIVVTILVLGGGLCVCSIIRSVASFALALRASKKLHDAMSSAVLRAKIEFFDTNPSGRILNRFSADVGSNDDLLPQTLFDFLMCAFLVAGSLITAVAAIPFILIIMPPLIWYFLRVRNMFVVTSRELKRIEGLSRSPIYAMLNESICGVATIRSNNATEFIKSKFQESHDTHSRAFWGFLASSRWLGFRMDFLMFINCSVACVLAVLFSRQDWFGIDPVIFGLALSMLLQLGSIFQWTIRQSAEVVNQMVCVERVSEYSQLESEADLQTETDEDIPFWPGSGTIKVQNLSIRYRKTLPLSLKGVTFDVPCGKRIGVVGRTGSGKSTLVQALFRILEAEEGKIAIDSVDIATMGLHKLRKCISVINQVPVLFSGCTVRENLDPFNNFSDDEIVDAITDVQMIDAIDALPFGINSQVAESGTNFSVGERQLLCLARALLQKSKILVLDEPTANVDNRTDKLLQEAVNKSFAGSTIISVAHRLDSVIENDLILVLGGGEVLEYGTPSELILLNGQFASMVDDTGVEMAKELKRRAFAGTRS